MVRLLPFTHLLSSQMSRVSIPQWCDCYFDQPHLYRLLFVSFNPTMVRLLLASPLPTAGSPLTFQSHNGAIATHQGLKGEISFSEFQSHNGAIATHQRAP